MNDEDCAVCGTAIDPADFLIRWDGRVVHPSCGKDARPMNALGVTDHSQNLGNDDMLDQLERVTKGVGGIDVPVEVGAGELQTLRHIVVMLRALYDGPEPWHRFVLQSELEEALDSLPVTDAEKAVADLLAMRSDLA